MPAFALLRFCVFVACASSAAQTSASVESLLRLQNDNCDFNTYDASSWGFEHIYRLLHPEQGEAEPALLRNVMPSLSDLAAYRTPEEAATVFKSVPLEVTWDILKQSRRGVVPGSNVTKFERWTQSLSPPYFFNFCTNPSCLAAIQQVVPAMLRNLTRKPYFTAGSESRGVRLHAHDATWGLLLAGSKKWYVGKSIDIDTMEDHSESELAGIPSCLQQVGEVVVLPENWLHATFNYGSWSLAVGGQEIATPDEFSAIFGQASPECNECLPLAARSGHLSAVSALLAQRADVHSLDSKTHLSALHMAAASGHVDILKRLAGAGGDLDLKNGFFAQSPMVSACAGGHASALKFLTGGRGWWWWFQRQAKMSSCIHEAVASNHLEIVEHLVGLGADLQERNRLGFTPVELAAGSGYLPILKYFLAETKGKLSDSALKLAREQGHVAVVNYLEGKPEL